MLDPRKSKEPEINTMKTSSMAAWNIGESAIRQQQMEASKNTPANKELALKNAVRKYQESQYVNYMNFLGELGALGYCAEPTLTPPIVDITPADYVSESGVTRAKNTYGDYKRQKEMAEKMMIENIYPDDGPNSKKPKLDDGWGDESFTSKTKSFDNKRGSNDDEGRPNKYNRFNDNNRNNGRSRGRGNRGGSFRGRYEPRDNNRSNNGSSTVGSGWSDDESKPESKKTSDFGHGKSHKSIIKEIPGGWDDDEKEKESIMKGNATPAPSPTNDVDDWD